jgi:heterodisulfide reductase subunit A
MIQCVGSRNDEHPYCSRICCSEAVKNALKIKELSPETDITVYHKDIRTYGFREAHYRKARESGVVFVRYKDDSPPAVSKVGDNINVVVDTPDQKGASISPDLLVLSAGVVADRAKNEVLAKMLKVPLNGDGFFLEAHVKLRPIDFATEGVFLCGLAHSPKDIEESIAQASGTVSRASIYLSKDHVEAEGVVSVVRPTECVGCSICIKNCAYNAISIIEDPELGKVANVNSALCKGCGLCAATCPQQAITSLHFTKDQLLAQIDNIMEESE